MKRNTFVFPMVLLIVSAVLPVVSPADTIRVPQDATSIQGGINLAGNGDTVLVADGTWTGTNNRNLTLYGRSITVRSAGGPDNCIIDCQGAGRGFHLASGEGPGARIVGFTITNGAAVRGAGIRCSNGSSPVISGNLITNCLAAQDGGGIACDEGSDAKIISNTISRSRTDTYGALGGGISCVDSNPLIAGNTIYENYSRGFGGGIGVGGDSQPWIRGNLIDYNYGYLNGAGMGCLDQSAVWVQSNVISRNYGSNYGGGISCNDEALLIAMDNIFEENDASYTGSGIYLVSGTYGHISRSVFRNNTGDSYGFGGGIAVDGAGAYVTGCLFHGNRTNRGGGIWCHDAVDVTVENCTIADNTTTGPGGGLYIGDSTVTVKNCIIWGNEAADGDSIYVGSGSGPTVTYSDVEGGWSGTGNMNQNPRFAEGSGGSHYLSQTAAGQPVNSPCVNAGNPGDAPRDTTRTDCVPDTGWIDMGARFPAAALVVGPGRGYDNPPWVRVFPPVQDSFHAYDFSAYGSPHYGVNVAVGDVIYAEPDVIVTGAGPGAVFGPHVRGFRMDGTPIPGLSYFAYGTHKYGVNVATGDIDGDYADEIITGAGPGAVFGPHVRAFDFDDGAVTPTPGVSYFAYGTLKWGVNVAAGDIDGDGYDEIITGAGPGAVFGPHVRGWNVDGGAVAAIPGVSFLAYGTNKYGVNVGAGDIDGDGIDEILTGPGPSRVFGTQVRGWNYDGIFLQAMAGCNFFAWPPAQALYGAKVSAGADLIMDGREEILVGAGPDPDANTTIRVYTYTGSGVSEEFTLRAFPESWREGANAAAGTFD